MDANSLMPGDNTDELPEAYVIFITENDVLGKGRPIYMVERTISDDCGRFDDGSHIIYVNGSYREDNSPLTKLVHDLFCPDPNKMNFKQLADRARYFKEDDKGVENMCEVMERFVYEERMEERFEAVRRMIKDGVLSYEKVAEYSGLPVEKVLEIAGKKTA